MTILNPRLKLIPDDLLLHRQRNDHKRARQLLAWCEHRNFRPTLAAIEAERNRRLADIDHPGRQAPGAAQNGENR